MWLDPPNPPQPSSQEVAGALGNAYIPTPLVSQPLPFFMSMNKPTSRVTHTFDPTTDGRLFQCILGEVGAANTATGVLHGPRAGNVASRRQGAQCLSCRATLGTRHIQILRV